MNQNDFDRFRDLINATAECYGKNHLSEAALNMFFDVLEGRTIQQFEYALNQHMRDSDRGRFMPKPADIEDKLTGDKLDAESIIARARNPRTPFDIQCRMHIGTFDLNNNMDAGYLRMRAKECIQLCSEWEQEAIQGRFSQNMIDTLVKNQIDPRKPYRDNLPCPLNLENINLQIQTCLAETKREKQLQKLEAPKQLSEEEMLTNREKLKALIDSL